MSPFPVMPQNYPLTWLFIIATVCVDLVVLFTTDRHAALVGEGATFYIYSFLMPAQFNTLAIWLAIGKMHRLARAAWVTFAFGSLLLLTWLVEGWFSRESNALNFIQFFTVFGGTVLIRASGIGRPANIQWGGPIRYSLIEMFGWTMIVALWAFTLRYVLGEMIVDKYLIVWIVVASVSPVLLVPILHNQLSTVSRLLWLTSLYLIAIVAYVVGSNFMIGPMPLWAFSMAITQLTYISAWWAVVRMDEAMQEQWAVSENARVKLAVFQPGDEEK